MTESDDQVGVRLAALHGELDDLFLLHEECLMLGLFAPAREVLEAYTRLLSLHARHEEELFLPLYQEVGVEPRYPLVLYLGQHEKMLTMLRTFEARTREIEEQTRDGVSPTGAPPSRAKGVRRAVLGLFDEHARFKHLAEHHDGSERAGFMAVIDQRAPAPLRRKLLERSLSEWGQLRAECEPLILRARALCG